MIKFWLSLVVIFFFQEAATTSAIIFKANQDHIGFLTLLLAWTILSALGTFAGYFLGKILRTKIANTKAGLYIEKLAATIQQHIGSRGEILIIILITLVNFIYINAFLCAWLKIDFKRMLLLMVAANTLNFFLVWEAVTHTQSLIANTAVALGVVIIIVLVLSTIVKLVFQKFR